MCLEFLFSSHREDDGPGHNHPPRNHPNDVTRQSYSGEQKNGEYYPDKNDPLSKPRYSSDPSTNGSEHHRQITENQVGNDRAAVNNGDTNMTPKEDHPKVGSMAAFNGGNKVSNAVHPSRPSDSVPHRHAGNNTVTAAAPAPPPNPRRGVESNDSVPHHVGSNSTVLAAPAPQPNPRRGGESNVSHDNGGTRYRNVRKDEEEEDEED